MGQVWMEILGVSGSLLRGNQQGIHTILNIACEKLNEMVNDSMTEEGCEDASNLLAQAIAVACMLTVTVDGKPWEMLFDAAISLMSLSKDHLDRGRGETCNA